MLFQPAINFGVYHLANHIAVSILIAIMWGETQMKTYY